MPKIDLNGAKINYECTGDGDPVLLITGLSGNIGFWSKVVPMLSDRYSVICIDNRGAGQTEYHGPFDIMDMADDAAALMEHLGTGPAHVLGWSMGSHIALDLAARHPDLVRSLTVVSSYLRRPSRSAYILNMMAEGYSDGRISEEVVGMVMNVLLRTEGFFETAESKGKEIRLPRLDSRNGMMDQMRAVEGYDPRSDAERISVPTLSIHGLEDIMTPPSCGDALADIIGGCRRYRAPGEGHVLRPESYIPAFLDFIGSLDC